MSKLSLSSRKARASIAVLLATVAASASAWDAGRMTGGGSIICPAPAYRVTFGYELHCQPEKGDIPGPNNLEVNFSTGEHFHLTTLTKAVCSGPDATTPFNTLTGAGSGTLNGEAAMIKFVLVDNGEPGTQDTAKFVITTDSWEKALYCARTLEGGNNQAHAATGNKP
jgi:hypothetical protein